MFHPVSLTTFVNVLIDLSADGFEVSFWQRYTVKPAKWDSVWTWVSQCPFVTSLFYIYTWHFVCTIFLFPRCWLEQKIWSKLSLHTFWDEVSGVAQDFVKKLLVVKPTSRRVSIKAGLRDVAGVTPLVICDWKKTCIFSRMTAEDALRHPFIAADSDFGLATVQEMASQTSCVHLPPRWIESSLLQR